MPHLSLPLPTSLLLEPYYNEQPLSIATGFTIEHNGKFFLVTNKHVVTGKDTFTNQTLDQQNASIPNRLGVWNPSGPYEEKQIGAWTYKAPSGPFNLTFFDLFKNEEKIWVEHHESTIDVVLIPFTEEQINFVPLTLPDTGNPNSMAIVPGHLVSILGYPFGISTAGRDSDIKIPIWKTGHLASNYYESYNQLPVALTDVSTTPGMSGSPVFAMGGGGYKTIGGSNVLGASGPTQFIGVYSGRVKDKEFEVMDIGLCWKEETIKDILSTINS